MLQTSLKKNERKIRDMMHKIQYIDRISRARGKQRKKIIQEVTKNKS